MEQTATTNKKALKNNCKWFNLGALTFCMITSILFFNSIEIDAKKHTEFIASLHGEYFKIACAIYLLGYLLGIAAILIEFYYILICYFIFECLLTCVLLYITTITEANRTHIRSGFIYLMAQLIVLTSAALLVYFTSKYRSANRYFRQANEVDDETVEMS